MNTIGDKRSWSDAQLRKAVEGSLTWRAVARLLGLKANSAGVIRTIKRHADRLGLDASHFTGQRRWSDGQMREAVPFSTSWAEVLTRLGVADNAASRVRVKGHAARLGVSYEHLMTPDVPSPEDAFFVRPGQLEMLRVAAPAVAMAWFALRGCPVALPVEPQVYDLLVTTEKGIQRVQVKSCTQRDGKGRWVVGIGWRPYVLDKTAAKVPYDPDSLDLFFILLGDGSIFLVPIAALAGRTQIYAHNYTPYRVGDASSLLT
ncbi:group I intron-associated PD-(D/E)XK endonuclease [Kribbella catacumbae]|uniref:group I intron-associated PD-(D/E)XK endonuclease n=1 Tax=Kribbella catacumbae TaxID=460086 RepID=UPI0003A1744E|nr:group I intron-associated PD-(D/E)XK endonuclease [Kribbella catacumbae]